MGPFSTGLAFIPLALAAGAGAHSAGHITGRHGVPGPLAAAFLIAAAGMTLLAHVGEDGSYLRDVLPGMLVAGLGLGIAVVSVSIAMLTGAREDEAEMISASTRRGTRSAARSDRDRLDDRGGERRGRRPARRLGNRARVRVASPVSLAILPHARHFVVEMRLNPTAMPSH